MAKLLRIVSAVLAASCFAASPASAEMGAQEKQEIEQIVRDYLLANPQVIEEAITLLRQNREAEAATAQTRIIKDSGGLIFRSEHQMVLGNPDGAIKLVEFFDYNCAYCKRAHSDMTALIAANPDLAIIMKEFPILSEGSVEAARLSVAVKDAAPESYMKFHEELLTRPGEANSAKALEIARELSLDTAALTSAANAPEVTANLQEVQQIANLLGISGTPSYVIGTELVPGAAGYDVLQEKVTAMRECGAATC